MKNRIKKVKCKDGVGANRMMFKKLCSNFFRNGVLVTTSARAKMAKSMIDRLVHKLDRADNASMNCLLSFLNDSFLLEKMVKNLKNNISNFNGGYVKMENLGKRDSDASSMSRITWANDIVFMENNSLVGSKNELSEESPVNEV